MQTTSSRPLCLSWAEISPICNPVVFCTWLLTERENRQFWNKGTFGDYLGSLKLHLKGWLYTTNQLRRTRQWPLLDHLWNRDTHMRVRQFYPPLNGQEKSRASKPAFPRESPAAIYVACSDACKDAFVAKKLETKNSNSSIWKSNYSITWLWQQWN